MGSAVFRVLRKDFPLVSIAEKRQNRFEGLRLATPEAITKGNMSDILGGSFHVSKLPPTASMCFPTFENGSKAER